MKRLLATLVGLGILGARLFGQTPPYPSNPVLQRPTSGLIVTYTVGQVASGGAVATIQSGSVTVTDSMTNCAAPAFSACNLIYWPGAGVSLSTTTNPGTAFAAGNVVIGYALSSSGNVTAIVAATPNYRPTGASDTPNSTQSSTSTFRYPQCNAILKKGCQASTSSLSGY